MTPNAGCGAAWSDAGVIIPWTSWLQTGDTTIIEQNWEAMTKYLDAIEAANPDCLWKNDYGQPFGDWLSPEGKTDERADRHRLLGLRCDADARRWRTPPAARRTRRNTRGYSRRFAPRFKNSLCTTTDLWPAPTTAPSQFGVINNPNAKSQGGDTQTGYVLALHMNLLPENLRAAAAKRLVGQD